MQPAHADLRESALSRYASAVQAHREGRLAQAEALYREVLAVCPDHAEALHQLGLLAMRAGEVARGIELLERSLRVRADDPAVMLHLAKALTEAGRREAALDLFDRLLARGSSSPEAWFAHATALMRFKEPRAALDSYERFLSQRSAHARAWTGRGDALQDLGRLEEALASYERALALQPEQPEMLNNRGSTLRKLKRHEEALASYEEAVRLCPDLAPVHNNLGLTLLALGRIEEALLAFERALKLDPTHIEAHINRGNGLKDLMRPQAALDCYERALALDPACPEALSNRGNALMDLGAHGLALESYARALDALPDQPDILANQASALLQLARYEQAAHTFEQLLQVAPTYEQAQGNLLQCRLHVCAWERYTEDVTRVFAALERGQRVVPPFSTLALTDSARIQLRSSQLYAQAIPTQRLALGARGGRSKLRLAYVSADLREHAVSYLMAGVFEEHDRGKFETTAISLLPRELSALGERVSAAFDGFVDVSRISDAEVVALMRELEIDIAVDLMGYTHRARPGIFARRAAPVQVSYLGYPGTLGAPFMDYILADDFIIPPETRAHYAEQVVYLPGCFQANDARSVIGPVPSKDHVGLPPEGLVLCSFNASYKLTPSVFDVWMRLLREIPSSVMWLLGDREDARANLRGAAVSRGVDPERLVFAPRVPYAQHLGRLGLADLFLDTLPYNAGTTASDALRVGVPVLTCVGEAMASRMAGSLLRSLGLPQLITRNLEEYERQALEICQPERLAAVRAELAVSLARAPLFDSAMCCQKLEAAYLMMQERAASGESPAHFAVQGA
jgi:predicted O-linked N-acetylglucosamine transferase (SPINDLY family)